MVLGWLWSSSSSSTTKDLDPSLQDILKDQESRQHFKPSSHNAPPQRSQPGDYTKALRESGTLPDPQSKSQLQSQLSDPENATSKVPSQSLYQDGRYAHLWKNYEPYETVTSRGETEMDKLKRVKDDFETRKAAVGQAALENCVFEQLAESECLKSGSYAEKLTLCRPQKQAFLRCYEMQCKFLRVLGYWDAAGDTQRADAIQMHSDALWQKYVKQDEEITKAKEEGRPLPTFENIMSPASIASVGGSTMSTNVPVRAGDDKSYPYPTIPKEFRERFEKRIKGMPREEAVLEEAFFMAELDSQAKAYKQSAAFMKEAGEARQKRFETGEATIGDRLKRMGNWDAWEKSLPGPADAVAREKHQEAEAAKSR